MSTKHDVAIVGYGPVGALLANLLGQAGLSVAVYERDTAIYALPRAVHFDGEVMRIFQSAGLAEQDRAGDAAFVAGHALRQCRGPHADGPARHRRARARRAGRTTGTSISRCSSRSCARASARFPNVEVHLGREVADVGELDARYIVGCDGARSLVRRAIGSRQRDLGLHQPWLVVDLLCDPATRRA